MNYLFLSFYAIILSLNGWLVKEVRWISICSFPCSFELLRMPLSYFCIWSKFWFTRKVWSLGSCQHPDLLRCRRNMLTFDLLQVSLNSVHCRSTRILCPWGAWRQMGWQGATGRHLRVSPLLIGMLHCPTELYLQKSKDEIVKNFKTAEH